MAKIDLKHAPLIYGVVQSGLTTAIAAAIATVRFSASLPAFLADWSFAWLTAWGIMLPVVIFASPLIQKLVAALTAAGADVTYLDVRSSWGHDAFLLEVETMTNLLSSFLDRLAGEERVLPPIRSAQRQTMPAIPQKRKTLEDTLA